MGAACIREERPEGDDARDRGASARSPLLHSLLGATVTVLDITGDRWHVDLGDTVTLSNADQQFTGAALKSSRRGFHVTCDCGSRLGVVDFYFHRPSPCRLGESRPATGDSKRDLRVRMRARHRGSMIERDFRIVDISTPSG
jgi:hypothetical protein